MPSLHEMNQKIFEHSRIHDFFGDLRELRKIIKLVEETLHPRSEKLPEGGVHKYEIARTQAEFGDYQTPPHITHQICKYLRDGQNLHPDFIIEPTCGVGNFIVAALDVFPSLKGILGFEKQPEYIYPLKLRLLQQVWGAAVSPEIWVVQGDAFKIDFSVQMKAFLRENGPNGANFLFLGNPPWVTNTKLSKLKSANVPPKHRKPEMSGLNLLTGASNFDIAESILLRIINLSAPVQAKIRMAMLCKQQVARNLVQSTFRDGLPLRAMSFFEVDTPQIFEATTNAGLFYCEIGSPRETTCCYFDVENTRNTWKNITKGTQSWGPNYEFGWYHSQNVSNLANYQKCEFLEGESPLTWRQGVKHDLTKICNLRIQPDGGLSNGLGQGVDVEPDYVFPFVKSSDIQNPLLNQIRYKVILTQQRLGEPTDVIAARAPKLWHYLHLHLSAFNARKSKVYHKKPPFAMFGVGDYTFLPYKVAISGFYTEPAFCLLPPYRGQPVIVDDTCYMLGFKEPSLAAYIWGLLNQPLVFEFLKSITFPAGKRPYTKKILQRIDLRTLALRTKLNMVEKAIHDIPDDYIGNAGTMQGVVSKLGYWREHVISL